MAGQDFANIKVVQPEDVRPVGQSKILLLTVVALIVVAGGFAIGFMVGQEMGVQKANSEGEARMVAQLKQQQEELTKLRAEAKKRLPEVSTTQVGELTFYNELPKQSVSPEPMQMNGIGKSEPGERAPTASPANSTAESEQLLQQIIERELKQGAPSVTPVAALAAAKAESHYLQLASFQNKKDAETFFPKLSRAGLAGEIRRVELAGKGTWYRVYAGPFASRQAAEAAKGDVKNKLNITGLIVKGG